MAAKVSPAGSRPIIAAPADRLASAAGFEPTTPGFIPLRLSPPPTGRSWSGLSLRHRPEALRRHPSSLYTFPGVSSSGLARDRRGKAADAFPDFERIHHGVSHRSAQFRSNIETRNPVLYPAELRGRRKNSSLRLRCLPAPWNAILTAYRVLGAMKVRRALTARPEFAPSVARPALLTLPRMSRLCSRLTRRGCALAAHR